MHGFRTPHPEWEAFSEVGCRVRCCAGSLRQSSPAKEPKLVQNHQHARTLYQKESDWVILKRPLGMFGGGFFWQRFAFKKASRSKMRCAGSSERYSRRTSSRKSSVTPTI